MTGPMPAADGQQWLVVKLGGEVLLGAAGLAALLADVAALLAAGWRVALVHGGGPQADALAARLGHSPRKVGGRRITGDLDLEIAKMVYGGSSNLDLLAALRRAGLRGVGLSGVDANLLTAVRRPPRRVPGASGAEEIVDFGHVGDIVAVDPGVLHLLGGAGLVPVVASLAADDGGALYNVNADGVAAALAGALRAARLILLTNVPGVLADPGDPASLLPVLDQAACARLIAEGVIGGGMLPKVQAGLDALAAGVGTAHILNGAGATTLLRAGFSSAGAGIGTRIVRARDG